ncbi:MAG: serine/threonine transporter SstT [Coriobacteriaceae bacterium]|nr:serine/threonine transporter SstT [Coriobacteriaceae bacterium]
MRRIAHAYNSVSLIIRILIGLVIGAVLGIFFKDLPVIPLLGTLFTGALKSIAPVLVFFLVISALLGAKADRSMGTIIILYLIGTLCAAIVAVVASMLFPSPLTLDVSAYDDMSEISDVGSIFVTLLTNIVCNPIEALSEANYLGVLCWAILLGIAMRHAPKGAKETLNAISDAITTVVRWIIAMAPFGILGLVYSAVSENGLNIFVEYGHLLLVLVGCMLFIALVVNPLIVFLFARVNPYPLVGRCLKDSAITAFFTRSSAANIPVNMNLCKSLGLNKNTYSVSIPLGATINMAGAAVTITVLSLAAAQTLGIEVHPVQAVILSVLAATSACGASGVPGGSLMLIPLACSLFGINADVSAQIVAIGFIVAVIQDSCETALNSSTDALFTATAELRQRRRLGLSLKLDGTPVLGPESEGYEGDEEDEDAETETDADAELESAEAKADAAEEAQADKVAKQQKSSSKKKE